MPRVPVWTVPRRFLFVRHFFLHRRPLNGKIYPIYTGVRSGGSPLRRGVLVALRDSASAHQSTVNGPAGWEYKILVYKNELFPNSQVDFDKTAATNEKELNDWAAKGWELDRDHGVYLILRRPKR